MKMKPIGDQILLKKRETSNKTKNGLILTPSHNNYETADVIAVGTGLFTQTGDKIPMTVTEGSEVILHSRLLKGDNEIELEGEKYILIRESEIAMVQLNRKFIEMNVPAKMLLQVHDELLFEVEPDSLEITTKLVKKTMEDCVKLNVPLLVDIGIGDNWMETK